MDLPPEILSVIGAIALAIPLTARALPKGIATVSNALAARTKAKADAERTTADAKKVEADAEMTRATADKIQAESAASMMKDLQERLEATEVKNEQCEKGNAQRDTMIEGMKRQLEADGELIAKFSERAVVDEKRINTMHAEIQDLRRVMRSGGLNA